MQSFLRAATAAAATAGVLAIAAVPAVAGTPTDSSSLRSAVTAKNVKKHMSALQTIANMNNGTRASGTPGYDASLAYVKGKLDATGYYTTTVQNFRFDAFRELATPVFARLSPSPRDFVANEDFITMDYSETGDVTGALVATNDIVIPPGAEASTSNSGCEPGDFTPASTTQLQVALMQRGTCDFTVKATNAQNAGYDAAVIFNEGQPGRDETLAGTLGATDQSTIPVIGTSFAIGEELYNQVRAGTVTVRVATTTEIRRNVPTANLIAETKTGRTDRQVVVGAHLDSVQEGPGINDNGSGTAQDLEIALQMAKLGVKPANQTLFAFWGAEESGLIGSQFYVDSLSSRQVKDTQVNLNFDMVGSPNFVRFVYDGDASDTDSLASTGSGVVEDVFLDYFSSQNLPVEPTAFDGRSDYDAFISVGIPAGGLFTGAEDVKTPEQAAVYGGTAGLAYDPCYHQACDTIDNLSMTALDQMSDASAHATLRFAQSGSAVEGTDKGKALGHGDHQGSHLRK
jgi:Zn-dependent M28 family amino/carboxypeptidase